MGKKSIKCTTKYWDNIISNYFSSKKPSRVPFTKYLRNAEESTVLKLIGKKRAKLLDISSEPRFYQKLRNQFDVTRIDFAECYKDYLKVNAKNYLFIENFPNNLKAQLNKFDLIICVGSYNYIPNFMKLTKFCHTHLKEGGKLVFTLKTKRHPDSKKEIDYDKTYSLEEIYKILSIFRNYSIRPIASVPSIKGIGYYFIQLFVPFIKLLDSVNHNNQYYLTKERSWYYAISATK